MTFISHVSPDGQCPSKAPDPRAQECSSPKGKSTSFCEIEIFFFFFLPSIPKGWCPTSVRACGIPPAPGSGFPSHPPHLIRKNSNHLQSHWLCANGSLQNTFLFYLKGFCSQCEALKPSPELPTRLPALPVTAQKSFSHQKGQPSPSSAHPPASLCSSPFTGKSS